MVSQYTLIKNLVRNRTDLAIRVRCVRLFDTPANVSATSGATFLDGVYHDTEGTRIQISISPPNKSRLKIKLKEGCLYDIQKFSVVDNKTSYKTTSCRHKINFMTSSVITEVFDNEFPFVPYHLVSINDILSGNCSDAGLIDVIGLLVEGERNSIVTVKEKPKRLVEIYIEDHEARSLRVALWEQELVDMIRALRRSAGSDPCVIILQMFRDKYNEVSREYSVSTAYNPSRIICSDDCEDIAQFKNGLIFGDNGNQASSSRTVPSISNLSSDLDPTDITPITLDQFLEKEQGSYWIFGNIEDIESGDDWCYMSCKTCARKIREVDGKLYCNECMKTVVFGVRRYKITVMVMDSVTNASFVIWDNVAKQLIGKTANALYEMTPTHGQGYPPEDIMELIGKKMLMRVSVPANRENTSFVNHPRIVRVCLDPHIVKKFADPHFEKQVLENIDDSQRNENSMNSKVGSTCDDAESPNKGGRVQENVIDLDEIEPNTKKNLMDKFSSSSANKKYNAVNIKIEKMD